MAGNISTEIGGIDFSSLRVTLERVTVQLWRRVEAEDGLPPGLVARVAVRSAVKPHVIKMVDVELNDRRMTSNERIKAGIVIAGGACGEALCQDIGDMHDPDEVAKTAGEAWAQLLRLPVAGQIGVA